MASPSDTTVSYGPADPEDRRLQEVVFTRIAAMLDEASSVAICAHTSPDGDALGSELGLAHIIRARWPHIHVVSLLADDDPTPRIYRFLPGSEELVHTSSYHEDPDVFIAVDLSDMGRLNLAQDVCKRARHVAVMDHHPTDTPLGDDKARIIRPGAAAAGIIVAEFALHEHIEITADIAQCLMCAIVTDTGRFQYQNSDCESFQVASLLVEKGASPSEISLNVYQSFRLSFLHLKSLVMGRITTFEKGRIAYSYATSNDFERTGAALDECDGLIDVVRTVEGSEIALFLKKIPGGRVRGNLRSKGTHDVSSVARLMGGGGHRAAAGFNYEGDIDEALAAVLPRLRDLLKEDSQQTGSVELGT